VFVIGGIASLYSEARSATELFIAGVDILNRRKFNMCCGRLGISLLRHIRESWQ
jgi:hypothetical protein